MNGTTKNKKPKENPKQTKQKSVGRQGLGNPRGKVEKSANIRGTNFPKRHFIKEKDCQAHLFLILPNSCFFKRSNFIVFWLWILTKVGRTELPSKGMKLATRAMSHWRKHWQWSVPGSSSELSSELIQMGFSTWLWQIIPPLRPPRGITQMWRHTEDSTVRSGRGFLFSVHSSTDFCSSATSFTGSKKIKSRFSVFKNYSSCLSGTT